MTDPLVVRLLGPPQFSLAASPIACPSKKSLALFAFLLLTGKAHSRHELAALLWGHRDGEAARTSLRGALHRLPAAMLQCLDVDRDSIGLAPSAAPLVDVARFATLAPAQDLDSLEEAAALYQDELLKDFEPAATPEFDDWLHAERVRLGQLAQNVFDGVIARRADRARQDSARATSERESALAVGLRWTSLMPGSEAAHRWLMRLYLDMGRRDAALAQFDLCQRFLAVTHGRAPSPETRALQEIAVAGGARAPVSRIAAEPSRQADSAAALDPTVVAGTTFVGRLEELAELERLFADPACRLITLHGLGGAGKTRLAHAFATQVGPGFAQGVSWVALEACESADAFPHAVAEALGRDAPARGDRAAAVAQMLARQQRLLVLDNFESLLEDDSGSDADPIAFVLKVLQTAPQVRIVVTSREVLGLQEEWVYEVRGLAFQAEESGPPAPAIPAVELFAQRARQAYLGFSLSAEMPHVLRICRLVEGLPLGIELAAAWVRTIPCADLAAAIEAQAGALVSAHRNRPHRHQSLEAVVACSWNLLRDDQRDALAGLGIFAGGFTRDTAESIADAPLRVLSALADKALVRRRAEGRYDLHELVRQFALARLQSMRTRHAAVAKRHGDHFASLLLQIFENIKGPAESDADAVLRTELANLLAAWERSVQAGRLEIVERMAAPMIALLHTRGRMPSAMKEAERAVEALRRNRRAEVIGAVRMQWGRAAIGIDSDVAARELDAALMLARDAGPPDLVARCLYYRSALDYERGNLDQAESYAGEALEIAARSTHAETRALVHNVRGTIANLRSQFDVAERLLRTGLAAAREQGSPSLVGGLLCSLAVPLYYQGRLAESAALTAEAARLYETLGKNATAITIRGNLAAISLAQGDLAKAREHAEVGVRLSREAGDDHQLSNVLATLGEVLIVEGNLALARSSLAESLDLAEAAEKPLTITEALYLLARIDLAEGAADRALVRILRLRDVLTGHALTVRVPMLVLVAAEWVAAAGAARRDDARRWVEGVERLEDVDATLRDKARQLLARELHADLQATPSPAPAPATLAEIQSDVVGFLRDLSP